MHTKNSNDMQRIVFLDYARVFAFLSVLIGHKFNQELSSFISIFHTPHITQQYLVNFFTSFFVGGGAGVIVFFMISGYIILHVVQKESSQEFLIKRVFRIYPLLLFAIFIQRLLAIFVDHIPLNLSTTLLQMSLFGDFFNTPYSLGGVEWTLRVEIIFYLFMFILSYSKSLKLGNYLHFFILTIITFSLQYIAPFPSKNFIGYFSTYIPFLFLGSIIYMYEKKTIHLTALFLFVILVFYKYFQAIEHYSPQWLNTNFAITGFFIFLFLWVIRNKLNTIPHFINFFILKLALLTYSVYLFHLFLWPYIGLFLSRFGVSSKILIVIILFTWCILMYRYIETPMNNFAKIFIKKYLHKK